jgi:4-hydroxythreonine-4-phosphate dehydrogenase
MKPRLAITLGDPSGIGPEIVSAALRDPRVLAACDPVVVGDPLDFALHHQPLPDAEMLSVPGLNKRLALGKPSKEAGGSAIESLKKAVYLVKTGQADGLVTAPVSKESFALADHAYPGHTEWLAADSGVEEVAMLMAAGELRALLMTRHIPLSEVSRRLTGEVLESAARLAYGFARAALGKAKPRLVACGLNPHAGDGGLLGREEKDLYAPMLRRLKKQGIPVAGPQSADAVFHAMTQGRYDIALAAYHDQGMIPLKVHAADRLVNLTLGLPYLRTSPGHGTAYDIAGKNRARPGAMIEAMLLAAKYAATSREPQDREAGKPEKRRHETAARAALP